MTKLFRQCSTVVSIILLTTWPPAHMFSCGPGLEADNTIYMLFQQRLAGDASLGAFYYTEHFLAGDADPEEVDIHRNCREWTQFTDGKAREQDVYTVLYNVSAEKFNKCIAERDWGSLADNSFIGWLRRNPRSMAYLSFAKRVEYAHLDRPRDIWGVNVPPTAGFDTLISQAVGKCNIRTPSFLQQRYAFQAVKMMYYLTLYKPDINGQIQINTDVETDDTALIHCYDTWLANSTTIVADWGRLYYGFSFADKAKRAVNLLKAFGGCESKKVVVYNYLSAADAAALADTVADPKLRALAHAYIGLKNPGRALNELKAVYKYDSGSKYLRLLLTREINKIENWILSPEVMGFYAQLPRYQSPDENADSLHQYYAAKNKEKDIMYARELQQWLATTPLHDAVSKDLALLGSVRLLHTARDFAAALPYLQQLKPQADTMMERQRLIEQVISTAYTGNISTTSTQDKLAELLTSLRALHTSERTDLQEQDYSVSPPHAIMNELYLLLSRRFQEKGNTPIAGLLYKKSGIVVNEYITATSYYDAIGYFDRYATPRDIDELMSLEAKADKSALEKFIGPAAASKQMLVELKGTLLLRQDKFQEALSEYNSLPDDYWVSNYDFKDFIRNSSVTSVGSLLPAPGGPETRYPVASKKLIIRDIVRLQQQLKAATADSAKARISFLLANSLFNISYYGKDWMVYSYGHSTSEVEGSEEWNFPWFSFYPNREKHISYYSCNKATDMYLAAIKYAGTNNELKAKCLLMLQLCTRASNNKSNIYLAMLRKRFAKTESYLWATTECPDIAE